MASSLELFTESAFVLIAPARGDAFSLSQAKVLHGHPDLKKDLQTISLLQLLADILLGCLPEGEPHATLYDEVRNLLASWESHPSQREQLLAAFILHFLKDGGYPLELEDCAQCGVSLVGKKAVLVPHQGGALCLDCGGPVPSTLQSTPQSLEWLKKLSELPLERVAILKLTRPQTRMVLLTTLEYLQLTFEKPLRTLEYYLALPSGDSKVIKK
jgi:DNA repair protein RecO (recombination protein O)